MYCLSYNSDRRKPCASTTWCRRISWSGSWFRNLLVRRTQMPHGGQKLSEWIIKAIIKLVTFVRFEMDVHQGQLRLPLWLIVVIRFALAPGSLHLLYSSNVSDVVYSGGRWRVGWESPEKSRFCNLTVEAWFSTVFLKAWGAPPRGGVTKCLGGRENIF